MSLSAIIEPAALLQLLSGPQAVRDAQTIREDILEREDAIRQWHQTIVYNAGEISSLSQEISTCYADIQSAVAEVERLRAQLPVAERRENFNRRSGMDRRISDECKGIFYERRNAARRMSDGGQR